MTPEQAIEVIRQATEQYRGTRKDHEYIAEALRILTRLVKDSEQVEVNE